MKTIEYGTIMRKLCAAVYDAAVTHRYFTVADVRMLLDEDTIAAAAPSRLIAAALRKMEDGSRGGGGGIIARTSETRHYQDIGHGRPVRVWKSMIV